MRIAMIGCGKLGLPVAAAWSSKGHDVVGYDVSPQAGAIMASRRYPHHEPGMQRLLDEGVQVRIAESIAEAVAHADIVFIAVQTPHAPEYEGVMRVPEERRDFDYSALKAACASVVEEAERQQKHVTMVVISTVLPGTSERELLPLVVRGYRPAEIATSSSEIVANEHISFVYAPMFIAQSTVVEDAIEPEFVLLGVDRADARGVEEVRAFFGSMHPPEKLRLMSVASAEATKVAYNCSLGQKIVNANFWMEVCHRTGADVDDVMGALKCATDRIVSPRYMSAGMGDGGGCHPRDMIALSHLAERLDLSYDLGGELARARERQTEWLAEIVWNEAARRSLPVVLLGKAYKRGTNLTTGSPAMLLKSMLDESPQLNVYQWDPHVDGAAVAGSPLLSACVVVIATDHDEFFQMEFPAGSVVIDPWGRVRDQDGVKVIRVGRR